ncbi:hypothetical protein V6N12_042155 [Hibiscus sabdariffa]|uniref:Uncharacterized protein n=1 Tax=Hibiscus sabdariffa TaxID=183260 RepID=A0ABR2EDY7_9ROSI
MGRLEYYRGDYNKSGYLELRRCGRGTYCVLWLVLRGSYLALGGDPTHLPVRLPCYNFTLVTCLASGIPLLAVKVTTSGMASSRSVTGDVYKAQERIHRRMADRLLLAILASCRLKKPPTYALRPIILDNACILCITAAAGTELVDAYSPYSVIVSSPGKEVQDPWAFYLHAALLRQAFTHCGKFPTAASRSLGCISVPVWLIIFSDQLLIIALVSYCLTN